MLCCIASGRWILHPTYLKDSRAAGIWLQARILDLKNSQFKFVYSLKLYFLASGVKKTRFGGGGGRVQEAKLRWRSYLNLFIVNNIPQYTTDYTFASKVELARFLFWTLAPG